MLPSGEWLLPPSDHNFIQNRILCVNCVMNATFWNYTIDLHKLYIHNYIELVAQKRTPTFDNDLHVKYLSTMQTRSVLPSGEWLLPPSDHNFIQNRILCVNCVMNATFWNYTIDLHKLYIHNYIELVAQKRTPTFDNDLHVKYLSTNK